MNELTRMDIKSGTDCTHGSASESLSEGFSVIVCSVHPDKAEMLRENIRLTIGDVDFETIIFDNRNAKLPIAAVYNRCAGKARYKNLYFVHEDVEMVTHGWGPKIACKLAEDDCGVIGFAGTVAMVDAPGGWNSKRDWIVCLYQKKSGDIESSRVVEGVDFEPAVAVDGFGMFVRKDVWQEFVFDEKLLNGFHCYDVDFSLEVGTHYCNYVVTSILARHYSDGNFGKEWIEATWRSYNSKWSDGMLPRVARGIEISQKELDYNAERVTFRVLKLSLDLGVDNEGIEKVFGGYPFTFRHFEHILKIGWRKLKKLRR